MSLPTNLDITAMFPFPGEIAGRPMETVRPPSATETVSATSSASSETKKPSEPEKPAQPSAAELGDNLQQLNRGLQNFGIEFELSEVDNRLITRVVDRETGELIRQIPSEEVLRIARAMEQTSSGLLLQATA